MLSSTQKSIIFLCYVFQALHRYFKRFDTTNIRREIIFWTFCFGAVYMQLMHLRRSASMRLDCINTHKLLKMLKYFGPQPIVKVLKFL